MLCCLHSAFITDVLLFFVVGKFLRGKKKGLIQGDESDCGECATKLK